MSKGIQRPNPATILNGLKDFQRDTVEYVFQRLYGTHSPTRRFLIADEVGLGKTMVAKGLIAKTIDHLWDMTNRIDIIYICSNGDIARQNLNKLNVMGHHHTSFASRITLLPVTLHELTRNKVNFVSFTPGTSFEMGMSTGMMRERATLYWMLQRTWNFSTRAYGPLNVLRGNASAKNFQQAVTRMKREERIDPGLEKKFAHRLKLREAELRLHFRFEQLCRRFGRLHKDVPREDREQRNWLLSQLRELLAETCLTALEPDLIILDEFQRFKQLIEADPNSEIGQLSQKLFNYADGHAHARVVLLSATPYKMYTLSHEAATGDDHYGDFLKTMQFLLPNPADQERLETLIGTYRRSLFRIGVDGSAQAHAVKQELETLLRSVMVRTERLGASADRNGMLVEVPVAAGSLAPQDVLSYLGSQKIARLLEQPDILEYWKSSPYLLNVMEDYDFKEAFEAARVDPTRSAALAEVLRTSPELLLSWEAIERYEEVDPANARLRTLVGDVIERGAWQLLWVPPALSYYQPEGVYANPALAGFTKRLVFSAWKMVPKALATLVSYEAERRMVRGFEEQPRNTQTERDKRRGLLAIARSEDRLTGMPVLALLYPCLTLAQEGDPLALARTRDPQSALPSLEDVRRQLRERISALVQPLIIGRPEGGQEDQNWYWAAPLLLDRHYHRVATQRWFERKDLAAQWSGQRDSSGDDDTTAWDDHVRQAKAMQTSDRELGKPPDDLVEVLVDLALGGPGIVALRALWRVIAPADGRELAAVVGGLHIVRDDAGQVAWGLRTLFNLPEVSALVRSLIPDLPYWRQVLRYNAIGGLQAVLDEYAHVLCEQLSVLDAKPEVATREIAEEMRAALSLRTTALGVDRIVVDDAAIQVVSPTPRLRSHFALRFSDERREDQRGEHRKEQVRKAFNSPFWPFVLASTSVGQEGLDFHTYCHAIVHWNLPANPVDLEQREGRIHRYKGHAVRKNLAERFGLTSVNGYRDPWAAVFATGKQMCQHGELDLVPYWVFSGPARIERHVPALPLSRDRDRLAALRRSLTVYRMVFGQNRQEDLLAYLLSSLSEAQIAEVMDRLCINLEPPHQQDINGSAALPAAHVMPLPG